MNYLFLKKYIYEVSIKMFPQICDDMDKFENKQYNYYFSLVNEIYKGLALCCIAIDIQAYSQIGTLLRQLFEQVATSKIISLNEKNLNSYSIFAKAKRYYFNHNKDDKELKILFDKSNLEKRKINRINYYSLGWLEYIGETEITNEKLLELAGLSDLINWRDFCNNFVHTNITYMELNQDSMINLNSEFIYVLSILFDVVYCSYHNLTKFDFKFDGLQSFDEFRKIYSQITAIRNDK